MDRRREQLEAWRKMTGRTPMKRMSYVQPYYVSPSEKKPTSTKPATQRVYPRTEVKKPRRATPLAPLTQNVRSRRSVGVQHSPQSPAVDRETMKEAFQRDIDDTVASILAEENDANLARGLNFDDSFCSISQDDRASLECRGQDTPRPSAHKRRRSCIYSMDQSMAFESSKIRYSLIASEYRGRKRKQRGATEVGDDGENLVFLTPVRRTSRRSRSICPHLEPKGDPCFSSPSELVGRKGCGHIRVRPNEALRVLQGSEHPFGANCLQRGAGLES